MQQHTGKHMRPYIQEPVEESPGDQTERTSTGDQTERTSTGEPRSPAQKTK